ncbi:hypothetical protein REPUB_Repub18cG0174500 [Reevesia pubescens]
MVFWVFGYGSLVWNPGFGYDEKVIGFIKDYRRVFDLEAHLKNLQGLAPWSTLKEPFVGVPRIVFGAVLKRKERQWSTWSGENANKIKRPLWTFSRYKIEFSISLEADPLQPALTGVIAFTSTPDKVSNKYYLGPAPVEEMARQIATAVGPCGNNRDYLFLLEKAMFDIGHEDDKVIELANEVRRVLGTLGKGISKEKKLVASPLIQRKSHTHTPSFQLRLLPEAVAMDS